MGIFMAFFRRFFGGYDSKFDILDKRGIQMILCILITFLWEMFYASQSWWMSLIIAILVYVFWCKGHYYYFLCGTESDESLNSPAGSG